MLKCPICDKELSKQTTKGWLCECGEEIPFGFEIDSSEDSCEVCSIVGCPKRKRPFASGVKKEGE